MPENCRPEGETVGQAGKIPGCPNPTPPHIHLRLHTEYSSQTGSCRWTPPSPVPPPTPCRHWYLDLANLFGMVKFYKGCPRQGHQTIIGADCWISNDLERDKPSRVLLICRNHQGLWPTVRVADPCVHRNKYRGGRNCAANGDSQTAPAISCACPAPATVILARLANGNPMPCRKARRRPGVAFPGVLRRDPAGGHPGTEAYIRDALLIASRLTCPWWQPTRSNLPARGFQGPRGPVCIAQGHVLADKRRPKDFTPSNISRPRDEMCALFADILKP